MEHSSHKLNIPKAMKREGLIDEGISKKGCGSEMNYKGLEDAYNVFKGLVTWEGLRVIYVKLNFVDFLL